MCLFFLFFFQAEDGIRDSSVTGVQTCALPISRLLFPGSVPFSSPMSSNILIGNSLPFTAIDRKSTRLNSSHHLNLVCRLLLENKEDRYAGARQRPTSQSEPSTEARTTCA